ncbi:phosphotransferase [Auraticoccus sp. F435]|uniref:Phosphotransferase n=1 Tax=Auraticoccus cholistanensis TaxID=2656650 RepID=A0A6A9UU03_9ACTN|nr:aminoglycoside phosphotransferase family protein [Auraticoccus cholistanensis]MVA75215.1 phosphotransferase [Auraticoccus cholistanensis]
MSSPAAALHPELAALCAAALGEEPVALVPLAGGAYNTTYAVTLRTRQLVLRIAPAEESQYACERHLLRNGTAALAVLPELGVATPTVVLADFSGSRWPCDLVFEEVVPGEPAPTVLPRHERALWRGYYRQLGEVARSLHARTGPAFGRVDGPRFDRWSDAFLTSLAATVADLGSVGLPTDDLDAVLELGGEERELFDEVTVPRLVHGDLWNVNVMLDPDAPQPRITGVFDFDRACWADPEAEWSLYMASRRPGTERDAFWETYPPDPSPAAARRRCFYTASFAAQVRLEAHRRDLPEALEASRDEVRAVLEALRR